MLSLKTCALRRFLLYFVIAPLLLAGCSFGSDSFRGVDLSVMNIIGEFELVAHNKQRIRLSDYRGKVVLIFFGYTHCPDVCSPSLTRLSLLSRGLGDLANDLQVLFISLDPKRDTPAQLANFVPKFHPKFVGLTGTAKELDAVARQFRTAYSHQPGPGHLIAHSGSVFALDKVGALRLMFRESMALEDIDHDVRLLLR